MNTLEGPGTVALDCMQLGAAEDLGQQKPMTPSYCAECDAQQLRGGVLPILDLVEHFHYLAWMSSLLVTLT